jgi:uncharacterized protein YaeQ
MALKATIFKAELQVDDLDRDYHRQHSLTIARHPSETDARMMVRVLAFALFASDALEFGRGLSTDDEADLFEQDLTGQILRWVDVGLPDERDLRKACARAGEVVVISYGQTADTWWRRNREALDRLANLAVLNLTQEITRALAELAGRNMRLQCTIHEGILWLSSGDTTLQVEPVTLKASRGGRQALP